MSSSNLYGEFLPLGAAVLLVGGAILGSRLGPVLRRRVESYVLLPALSAIVMAWAGWAIWQRSWLELAMLVTCGGHIVKEVLKRLRQSRLTEGQSPPTTN